MSPKTLLQPLNQQIQSDTLIYSYLSHLLSFKANWKVSARPSSIILILKEWDLFKNGRELKALSTSAA